MKRKRLGFSALLLAASLACGCGSGGGGFGGGQFPTQISPNGPGGPVTGPGGGGGPTPGRVVADTLKLPQGYEQPRGLVAADGGLYVTARETATQKAVVIFMRGTASRVVATGDVLGTPNAMTDPVALAAVGSTLYVADASSSFSPGAAGAILAIKSGTVQILSAGAIDGPTGLAPRGDGSLAVCGSDPSDGQGAVFAVMPDGTTTLLAKGGPLTDPTGLGATPNGTLFVADAGRRLPSARLVSVGAQGGAATVVTPISDSCDAESGVATLYGSAFVAARHGSAGKIAELPVTGGPESPALEGGQLSSPQGVTSDGNSLYVADLEANDILVVR